MAEVDAGAKLRWIHAIVLRQSLFSGFASAHELRAFLVSRKANAAAAAAVSTALVDGDR